MCAQETEPFFRWREHYRMGDAELDRQHEELAGMVSKLHDMLRSGQSRVAVDSALDSLIDAVKRHFRAEERLMKDYEYPKLEGHTADHRSLGKKLDAFREQYRKGEAEVDNALLGGLKDWLRDHLLLVDKPLGAYLERKRLG